MKPITLINPKNERRDFGFVEFYGFKQQVANSQSFKFWADVKGLPRLVQAQRRNPYKCPGC